MGVVVASTNFPTDGPLAGRVTEVGGKTWALHGTSTGWAVASGKVGGPIGGPNWNLSLITIPTVASSVYPIRVTAVITPQPASAVGLYLGPTAGYGFALMVQNDVNSGGLCPIRIQVSDGSVYWSGSTLAKPAAMVDGVPATWVVTIDPVSRLITASVDGVQFYSGTPFTLGAFPWRAGLITQDNSSGVGQIGTSSVDSFIVEDMWPTSEGNAPVGVAGSSHEDLFADSRIITADSPVGLSSTAPAIIYSMTATGLSPAGLGTPSSATISAGGRVPSPLPGVFIGDPFMGGFLAGVIDTTVGNINVADASQVGERYALIVSPKSLEASRAYKTVATVSPAATLTRWNGLTATAAMAADAETYPAADYCAGLTPPVDAASAWYFPAIDELEVIYRNLKSTTDANTVGSRGDVFIGLVESHGTCPSSDPPGAAHTAGAPARSLVSAFWTSGTEFLSLSQYASTRYPGTSTHAWYQQFYDPLYGPGSQNLYSKTTARNVRPVRRFTIPKLYPVTADAPVGVATPSVVDMIVDTRFVAAESPVVVTTSDTASIYSMTATGSSPVGMGSSTRVATNITSGTSAIKLATTNAASRLYPPNGPWNQNWSADKGLDGGFTYPAGCSVDTVNLPTGVGATGSLKFPAAVSNGSSTFYHEVSITKTLVTAGNVTYYHKTSLKNFYDYLKLYVDGVYKSSSQVTGETAWTLKSFAITEGTHTFQWRLYVDYSTGGRPPDSAWISQVTIPAVATPPSNILNPVTVESSSLVSVPTADETSGMAPIAIESSSTGLLRGITDGVAPVAIGSNGIGSALSLLTSYDGEPTDILVPVFLTGVIDPIYPEPVDPVDFDGLLDPLVAPTLSKSDTAGGHLLAATYRYTYAGWKGTTAQATAPSPPTDITLTDEDTVTLTYPTIDGADGYLVYREEI